LRGNHGANSDDVDDVDDAGRHDASDGRGSGGGGNSTAGGGGRNDGALSLCETVDPQRSIGAGSRLPIERKAGRQSFRGC